MSERRHSAGLRRVESRRPRRADAQKQASFIQVLALVLAAGVWSPLTAAAQDEEVSLQDIEQWILTGRYGDALEQLEIQSADDAGALRLRVAALP